MKELTQEFCNPFIESTINMFETMVFCTPVFKGMLKSVEELYPCDISSTISITGNIMGAVSICFRQEVACKVIGNMLGEENLEFDQDVEDGVGELSNVITGGAKKVFSDKGNGFDISLPSIVKGLNHHLVRSGELDYSILDFEIADVGHFFVQIAVKAKI